MELNKLEIFPSPWPLLKHNAFWQKKIGKKEMNWELFLDHISLYFSSSLRGLLKFCGSVVVSSCFL